MKLGKLRNGLLFFFFIGITGSPVQAGVQSDSLKTTIYLVRHAERDPGENPPLNASGRKRALALRTFLADSGISVICCPNLIRNIQTAKPLAETLNIEITVLPDSLTNDSEAITYLFCNTIVPVHQGKTILFIGNMSGNTLGSVGNLLMIYQTLGGPGNPLTRYNDGYKILFLSEAESLVSHFTYGEP